MFKRKALLLIFIPFLLGAFTSPEKSPVVEYGEKDKKGTLYSISSQFGPIRLLKITDNKAYGTDGLGSLIKYDLKTLKKEKSILKSKLFRETSKVEYELIYTDFQISNFRLVLRKKVLGKYDEGGFNRVVKSSEYFSVLIDRDLEIIPSSRITLFTDLNVPGGNGKWPSFTIFKGYERGDSFFHISCKIYGKTTITKERGTKTASTDLSFKSYWANNDFTVGKEIEKSQTKTPLLIQPNSAWITFKDSSKGLFDLKIANNQCLGYSIKKQKKSTRELKEISSQNFTNEKTRHFANKVNPKTNASNVLIGTYLTSQPGNYYLVYGHYEHQHKMFTNGGIGVSSANAYTSGVVKENRLYKVLILHVSNFETVQWHKVLDVRNEYMDASSRTSSEDVKFVLPDVFVDKSNNLNIICLNAPISKKKEKFEMHNFELWRIEESGNVSSQILFNGKDKTMPFPSIVFNPNFQGNHAIRYYVGSLENKGSSCLVKLSF